MSGIENPHSIEDAVSHIFSSTPSSTPLNESPYLHHDNTAVIGAVKTKKHPLHIRSGGKSPKEMPVTDELLDQYTVVDLKEVKRSITEYEDDQEYDGVLYTTKSGKQWFVTHQGINLPHLSTPYHLNGARKALGERTATTLIAAPPDDEVIAYYREHAEVPRQLIEYAHNENEFFFKQAWPYIEKQIQPERDDIQAEEESFCELEVNLTDYSLQTSDKVQKKSCGVVDIFATTRYGNGIVVDFGNPTDGKRNQVVKYYHGSKALIADHNHNGISPPVTILIGQWSVDEHQTRIVNLIEANPRIVTDTDQNRHAFYAAAD